MGQDPGQLPLFREGPIQSLPRPLSQKAESLEESQGDYRWPRTLRTPGLRRRWRADLSAKTWVVYSRATLGNTRAVVRYLARYTNRIAISNKRLRVIDAPKNEVEFDFKDYRDNERIKRMRLKAPEFIRRFATHIAPRGLRRIRYGGILNPASRHREVILSLDKIGEKARKIPRSQCSQCGAANWTMLAIHANVTKRWHPQNDRRLNAPLPGATQWLPRNNRFPLHAGVDPPIPVQLKDAADAEGSHQPFPHQPGPADP